MQEQTLNVEALITGLGGGLALFLYGMRKMTEALKTAAGGGMKTLLARLTTNRFTGALAGIVITAVIQSSSVTTVLVVGFISAGLLSLSQSIGVILGASVGTTVTAQIIAFKVTKYALALIAIGFLMELLARKELVKHYGIVIMGLGLIFFGMELMSQATYPLRSYTPFIELMRDMRNPLLGILIGTAFTAIVQSSSATTGVVIVLAGQGFIALEVGIALVFGANIGTCVTAMLAAIGKPREAVQAAVVHVVYKVVGVLIWLPFIPQLADVVRALSPAATEMEGIARLAADSPRQIANAHTLFNVANMLLFIWFTPALARLARWIAPERTAVGPARVKAQYLEAYYLQTPALALDRVKLELGVLGSLVLRMVRDAFGAISAGTREQLTGLAQADEDVDVLHGEIITYLGRLSLKDLIESQPKRIYEYIAAANYIENIGDVIESGLASEALARQDQGLVMSPETVAVLQPLHDSACWAADTAVRALTEQDVQLAAEVTRSKAEFNRLADQARNHLAQRLVAEAPEGLELFRSETDIIDNLKRVHTLSRRLARTVEQVEGAAGERDSAPAAGHEAASTG